jgi:homogentisate 1,2-dioxygenase
MMDSFRPLHVAKQALAIEDPKYHQSWIETSSTPEGFSPPTS